MDSSPVITPSSSLSLSEWRADGWDTQDEQSSCSNYCLSRSDSLEEWTRPPLPGQVPVEPTETSHGLTAPGAMEASPVSSTGLQDHCPPEVSEEPRFHAVPANVWALGVMLYKMVNACPPFRSRTEITRAKVTFRNANLTKECSDLIGQCLARDPTKWTTLEQMLQHEWIRNDLL